MEVQNQQAVMPPKRNSTDQEKMFADRSLSNNGDMSAPSSFSFIDTSCESEAVRERVDNLQKAVMHLQQELKLTKARKEGEESLSSCLREEREQNRKQGIKISKLERTLGTLKKRLEESGQSLSLSLEEQEHYIPGPSRAYMENLVRENARLQQYQKYAQMDPMKIEELNKQIEDLKIQIESYRENNIKLSQERESLLKLIESSPREKDCKLVELEEKLRHMERNKETQDVLCQSLSEETMSLKTRLGKTVDACQELQKKMETKDTSQQKRDLDDSLYRLSLIQRSPSTQADEENAALRAQVEALSKEILMKDGKINEINDMNRHWQAHCNQREQLLRNLQREKEVLENKLVQAPSGASISEYQQSEIDRLILQSKQKVETIEDQKQLIQDENRALRIRVQQLQNALVRAEEAAQRNQQAVADKDRIQVLEAQIAIFREDFESERQDRERTQTKLAQVQEEKRLFQEQCEDLQRIQMQRFQVNREASRVANYNQYEYHNQPHENIFMQQRPLVSRGMEVECDGSDEEGIDEVDTLPSMKSSKEKQNTDDKDCSVNSNEDFDECDIFDKPVVKKMDSAPEGKNTKEEQLVLCPKCKKEFSSDKHDELLEHMEECCE